MFSSKIQDGSDEVSEKVAAPRRIDVLGMGYRRNVARFSRIVATDLLHF
jgi:hypothetical protein